MSASAIPICSPRSPRSCSAARSILGGSGTYAGTIAGAILLVTITALITVVNASPGWRSILFGSLILGLLLLSGRDREAAS